MYVPDLSLEVRFCADSSVGMVMVCAGQSTPDGSEEDEFIRDPLKEKLPVGQTIKAYQVGATFADVTSQNSMPSDTKRRSHAEEEAMATVFFVERERIHACHCK